MATTSITKLFNPILRSPKLISPSILRPYPRLPRTLQPAACRFAHTIPKPRSSAPPATSSESSSTSPSEKKPRKLLEPHYELTFTCVPCGDRSTHTISKQGYHKGSVLITCPSCRNRHVISDHLNIFGNRKITVEDLMREKGQLVKRGTLGEDGDVEFWEDGTTTERISSAASSNSYQSKSLPEEDEAARDSSSQSTEPTNNTSTPLSNSNSRPSLDSSQHMPHVPSTRRQYSTNNTPSQYANGSKLLGPFRRPYLSGPTKPSGTEFVKFIKFIGFVEQRGMRVVNRASKEEFFGFVRKRLATERGSGIDSSPQAKAQVGRETDDRRIADHTASEDKKLINSTRRNKDRAKSISMRPPRPHRMQPRSHRVWFYGIDTVDGRPRYIRTGPGRLRKERRPPQPQEEILKPGQGATPQGRVLLQYFWSGRAPQYASKDDLRRSTMEQSAARRSKGSNEFIRVPS